MKAGETVEDFERLLRDNYGPLERYVKFRMDGTGEAEDVLQEVCMAAFQKFHQLRDREKFKPWILQIARNQCRDYFRRKQPEQMPLETAEHDLTDGEGDPLDAVRDTMEKLTDRDRLILELTFFEELSEEEIAKILHIPVGTVKSRKHAARQRFREKYPYPPREKGERIMTKMPVIMPEYAITPSGEAPFPVKWEELMGWFIVPREGEKLRWGMYDGTKHNRMMWCDMAVTGKVKIHGIEGVEIRALEYEPVPSERVDTQDPVERILAAQLTDTHCRILAETHTHNGVKEVYTFLDGDDFLKNWGFGPDNRGNEIELRPSGIFHRQGDTVTADAEQDMDVVGRYTVTIGGKAWDTICVLDVEDYEEGVVSEQFLDPNGRTVLWRRFNRDDWAFHHFGKLWTEALPDNERVTINGQTYVHWYDCITDYVL